MKQCVDCGKDITGCNGRMKRCPDCGKKFRRKYNADCERKRYDEQHPKGRYRRMRLRARRKSPSIRLRPGIASSIDHENAVLEEDSAEGYDSVNKIDRNEYDILFKKHWKNWWVDLGDYKKLCDETGVKSLIAQNLATINDKKNLEGLKNEYP